MLTIFVEAGRRCFLSRVLRAFTQLVVTVALVSYSGQLLAQQPVSIQTVLDGHMRPDVEVSTFAHMDTLYPSNLVKPAVKTHLLPIAPEQLGDVVFQSGGRHYDLFDYLAMNRVAALLVLKNGKIVLEDYELGTSEQTRWTSFSMAKSVTSTLIGVAVKEGLIASLDDPVTRYVPALRGSVYDVVSIRNLLQMASGVQWNETYTDPASDCRKLADAQREQKAGASLAYMKGLRRAAAPGSVWNYNSGETNIAGAIVEGATHMSLAAYLSQTLWSPLGMEHSATWWTESPAGLGLGGTGLNATLRDYGRFGLFVLAGGVLGERQMVPDGWFEEATKAHLIGGKSVDYGYQWWPEAAGDPIHRGAFEARGIFGQRLYINPGEKLVIVVLSARSKAIDSSLLDDAAFFAAVAKAFK